jgi:hypothetical protein
MAEYPPLKKRNDWPMTNAGGGLQGAESRAVAAVCIKKLNKMNKNT